MVLGRTLQQGTLSRQEVEEIISQAAIELRPDGRRLVILIPDLTRSGPIPLLFRLLCNELAPRAAKLDFMVALGTHAPLDEEQISQLCGIPLAERKERYPGVSVLNHQWRDPSGLEKIGVVSAREVADATGGLLAEDVDIVLNRRVLRDYDEIIVCGPVFPHEVVGFSGGNKYLFPGVSGEAFIQFFHWLGALHTNPRINGNQWTLPRKFVDRAAGLIPVPRKAFCFVVDQGQLAALHFGEVEEAWAAAVECSRARHIIHVDRPFRQVLAEAPEMYGDLWVGGKCMYKLENVVADGGELIIHAPHIEEVSHVHGRVLDEVGYHVLDYFVQQWDRFKRYPWGVLAHATHVRGIGSFQGGVEKPRVDVSLATRIPEERCRRIHLGYRDPRSIRKEEWMGRDQEGILYVPHAGEILYRLKEPPEWARP
jgi:nickel-dependent lactate racemase